MRVRVGIVVLLLVAMAVPAQADAGHEPMEASEGRPVGLAADTNSLNGIYVSPYDGNLYVASVGGDEITVHDPRTGDLLDRIGPERGVHGPDDVFITDDGTIYWTEILRGYVGMLRPGELPVHQFVGPGVNPITMSDDGRLFVGRLFLGQGLYELDPNLVDPPVAINESLNVNSFDFGPDGYLYAPSFFTGDVLRIDVDSPIPVTADVVASGLGVSSAVKFNSKGEAFAVSIGAGQVVKVDFSGANAHELVYQADGTIDNIAVNAADNIYAAVGADNEIVRIGTRGQITVLTPGGMGLPGDVAVSPDGTVWVSELFALNGFTKGIRPTTSFYDRFSPPGAGFAGSTTVSPDGDNLVISSGFSGAVQVMDPSTGDILLDVRNLIVPSNAIKHGDTVVAAQVGLGNVVNAEDPSEVLLAGLFVPLGMASDGDTLYVADWATGIVWAVDDGGGVSLLAAGLTLPEGMAFDGDRLLVVEPPLQQVTAIDLATGDMYPVIVGLDYSDRIPEGFFPFGLMSGVAATSQSIYVSDDGVNQVYEFKRN